MPMEDKGWSPLLPRDILWSEASSFLSHTTEGRWRGNSYKGTTVGPWCLLDPIFLLFLLLHKHGDIKGYRGEPKHPPAKSNAGSNSPKIFNNHQRTIPKHESEKRV